MQFVHAGERFSISPVEVLNRMVQASTKPDAYKAGADFALRLVLRAVREGRVESLQL